MVKTYVIDTNVLIQAPYAMQCFEENQVVLPLVVLEELDGLKKADGERGANARRAIRLLEKLRGRGDLLQCRWITADFCGWKRTAWMWNCRKACRKTRRITGS